MDIADPQLLVKLCFTINSCMVSVYNMSVKVWLVCFSGMFVI